MVVNHLGHDFEIKKEIEAFKARDAWSGHTWFSTRGLWCAYSVESGKYAGAHGKTRKQCIENLTALSIREVGNITNVSKAKGES